ncbi:DUF6884 domain-containing protein [Halobaculum magnesiiphilum]|uniref:DUF6884 domain-containing protein n=1 Tax=Halobaculum magnesiiphilum TaxID=1017351 RepID=A0A8T8WB85_9EURY|nr:DUF6884 domain-containing protein [Halobaculum magnesiiphilum]QZP37098.1 hypothetical protein K6T50_12470 [Halobaculum magnesiiphilum]
MKYVLVGCGAAKRDERSEARDLYTSTYFAKKRAYAETVGDEWAILSAEHGLVEPDAEIDPYETHIDDLDDHRLNQLAHRIGMELIEWLVARGADTGDEIIVLAGRSYVDPLRERETFHAGIEPSVSFPFEQLDLGGIGEQMSWLGERVAAATAEQSTLITDGGEPLTCDDKDCDEPAHVRVFPTHGETDHSALRCRDCYERDAERDWFDRWARQIQSRDGGDGR